MHLSFLHMHFIFLYLYEPHTLLVSSDSLRFIQHVCIYLSSLSSQIPIYHSFVCFRILKRLDSFDCLLMHMIFVSSLSMQPSVDCDCSHTLYHHLKSFNDNFFPIKPGGVFVLKNFGVCLFAVWLHIPAFVYFLFSYHGFAFCFLGCVGTMDRASYLLIDTLFGSKEFLPAAGYFIIDY